MLKTSTSKVHPESGAPELRTHVTLLPWGIQTLSRLGKVGLTPASWARPRGSLGAWASPGYQALLAASPSARTRVCDDTELQEWGGMEAACRSVCCLVQTPPQRCSLNNEASVPAIRPRGLPPLPGAQRRLLPERISSKMLKRSFFSTC